MFSSSKKFLAALACATIAAAGSPALAGNLQVGHVQQAACCGGNAPIEFNVDGSPREFHGNGFRHISVMTEDWVVVVHSSGPGGHFTTLSYSDGTITTIKWGEWK